MRAQNFSERGEAGKWILRALIFSLLIHLTAFGTWKWSRTHHWWEEARIPAWLKLTPKLLTPQPKKIAPPPRPPQPLQLTFVDVDPALAEATPPKQPKFYSSQNSVAANPHPKNSEAAEIDGRQNKVVKTTANIKSAAEPLRPSPAVKPAPEQAPPARPPPRPAEVPGDLAMAKPAEKPPEPADAKATAETPEPVHQRPRTIAEAMAQHGMLGEKSHQEGGAPRLKMDSSLDAMKTTYGDYDREFIEAVQTRWYQLLDGTSPAAEGRVVVEFRLHPDGRVSDLSITVNTTSELRGLICAQAISDPKFRPWPMEMRREIPKDYRDVTFTFYYSNE